MKRKTIKVNKINKKMDQVLPFLKLLKKLQKLSIAVGYSRITESGGTCNIIVKVGWLISVWLPVVLIVQVGVSISVVVSVLRAR